MKILNEEHFENVRRYAESIGDTSLQKCLERLKSWEENPDCPCEISLYYDHAPYSFGFTQRYPDGRTGIVGGLLYHGIHDIVKIREGKENIVWIDLKQITNHIQVIVHNLNDKKKHIIYIEDNNGKYDSFLQYADDEKITYLPTYSNPSNTTSSLIADFTVMKLDKNREPRLKISDDTGVIRYDENLIGKLLQKKPYIDFDYNHDFTIEISFNDYIPVSIKINGWEIINESV